MHEDQIILGGRYRLLDQVGLGGMARVYLAHDEKLQRDVAIKILREDWIDQTPFRSNFLHEARSAANLSHPNIVTIFDFVHDADQIYIVMEYVLGTDLKTLIRRRGHFDVVESIELMIKICHGAGYAHRAGLIHCDLKPQNILIMSDGGAKITDFGIARALAGVNPDEKTDVVWGSPLYFAPEQARGDAPSPASDVYALGVILYEMLTGEPVFQATDNTSLAEMHINTPPPSPRRKNPEISTELEQIILKVLSKEPSNRYRTADQLGRILETLIASPVPVPRAKGDPLLATRDEPHDSETMSYQKAGIPEMDWLAIGLGLAAFLALGGLLPLWLWVCLLYPSCPINVG